MFPVSRELYRRWRFGLSPPGETGQNRRFAATPAPSAVRLLRFLKIARVASRYGLDQMILEHEP
ncbi:MAG: hypothetical protein K2Q19_13500, partial [Rhodocyclaceae bacterium]|nr:hypothetical protein [Rhodocyclaceae bacterium]